MPAPWPALDCIQQVRTDARYGRGSLHTTSAAHMLSNNTLGTEKMASAQSAVHEHFRTAVATHVFTQTLPVWHRTSLPAVCCTTSRFGLSRTGQPCVTPDTDREVTPTRYTVVVGTALLQAIGFATLCHAGQGPNLEKNLVPSEEGRHSRQFFSSLGLPRRSFGAKKSSSTLLGGRQCSSIATFARRGRRPVRIKGRRDMAQASAVADISPIAAASLSAVLSTVIASPLDVLKTRMQTSQRPSVWPAAAAMHSSASPQAMPAAVPPQYRNAWDGLIKIARTEGPAQLWRGTDLSLAVCVPAMAVYFPLYEYGLQYLQSSGVSAAPFVAGAAARAVTAFAVSPMELIRVRVQGSAAPAGVPYTQQLLSTVRSIHAQGEGQGLAKFRSFWRGMGVTLAKDVPFAAAYWSVLEPLRATMLPTDPSASPAQMIAANAAAGYGAAAVTAAITTPLDVAKTRMQTASHKMGMGTAFKTIMAEGGVRRLYIGAGPRSARAGCAYAILMSSYEAFKGMGLTVGAAATEEQ